MEINWTPGIIGICLLAGAVIAFAVYRRMERQRQAAGERYLWNRDGYAEWQPGELQQFKTDAWAASVADEPAPVRFAGAQAATERFEQLRQTAAELHREPPTAEIPVITDARLTPPPPPAKEDPFITKLRAENDRFRQLWALQP
ncbi:MAG TPA: hypothetical protein VHE33_17510 [Acidobacteriaceae bacterium]|nr:hypothetical protein [Acidobacteriaceae bacterium]